jgi:hypothetical protein
LKNFKKEVSKMIKGNKGGFYLLLFLFLPLLLHSAPIKLRIANKSDETLYNKIISYNISLARTPKVLENGNEVPAQFKKEAGQLLILLPGITKPNQEREILLYPEEKPSAKTDLAVEEGKDYIKISNSYFSVVHPKRGNGGFPTFVSFSISGNREQFVFEDRLYEKNEGYFTLRADPESTARILSKGPLEVVVEARARYYSNGRYARGNARATYIYKYFAY